MRTVSAEILSLRKVGLGLSPAGPVNGLPSSLAARTQESVHVVCTQTFGEQIMVLIKIHFSR